MEEYWDALDGSRRLVHGTVLKRGQTIPRGLYHTVIHILIFNSTGQFLSQQRTPNKTFPQMWDVTVGGSALTGETSQQAAGRELKEELGISRDFSHMVPVFTVKGSNYFDDYYYLFEDTDLSTLVFQPDEVQNTCWMSFTRCRELIEKGQFIPYRSIDAMELLYLKTVVENRYGSSTPLFDYEGIDYEKYFRTKAQKQ